MSYKTVTFRHLCGLLSTVILWSCWVFAQPPTAGRLIAVRGRVEVRNAPAQLNQELFEGDTIRTFEQSRAIILLADETQLKLNANTDLQLQSASRSSNLVTRISEAAARTEQSILNVGSGQVYIRSKKTPARVQVNTPAVTAAIRGTEFDIAVQPDGETLATVLEGSIDYRNNFGEIVVNAGEQGVARVGEAPTKIVILNPENAVQWTFFYTAAVSGRDYPFIHASPEAARAELESSVTDPVRRAMLFHDAGEYESALLLLENDLSLEASLVRGWILLEQNQVDQAILELESAEAEAPRTRLGLSLAHLRAGDIERAREFLEPADTAELRLQRAFLQVLSGEVETARGELEGVPRAGELSGLAQGLLSTIALTQNRQQEALDLANRAVESDPYSPSARVALSRAMQSVFDLPAARASAERALEIDPSFLDARIQYARILFGEGLTGRAEAVVQEALRTAPDEAGPNALMGFIVLARGKTAEAEGYFQKALGQDSTLADARLGLGLVRMRRNEAFDAAAEFLSATTLEPRLSLYQSYLAKAFYELREFDQAFTALETATQLDERDPTPHLYSGIFLDDLNRPGQAVQSFEESIRLNDNRAVYRSRYLLDQDRAARNVDLARSFNRLGLSEWGNSVAVRSELDDPSNSSAHLFLANTFLNLPGRTLAAGSELLLTRLLAPVNANSFNSFNDYTTLFELPRLYWTVAGGYGTFNARRGSLISTGGTPGFAYNVVLDYDRNDGFRPVNDDSKQYTGVSILKFALSPESDLLFYYANQQSNEGDHGSQVLVNEFNDPDRRSSIRTQRAEIGYHRRLRPGSELLLLVAGQEVENVINDPNFRAGRICSITFCERRIGLREPSLDFQASHLLDVGPFQLNYGLDVFRARSRERFDLLIQSGDSILINPISDDLTESRFRTAFFRSNLNLLPNLVLSGGVNWTWHQELDRLNASSSKEESASRWNPQGGLFFQPFASTELRFAYFQNLQAQRQARLVPPHLLGFPIDQNEQELTHSRSYNLGWDQRLGRKTFLRSYAFWRDRSIPTDQPVHFEGHYYGGRTVLNRFLTERWTLLGDYSLNHNLDTFSLRHDHEIDVAMRYVHPYGIFVTARENYLLQTGQLGTVRTSAKVFTTDIEAAYEMPRKFGLAVLTVSNLFDRRYEFLVDPLALVPRVPARQVDVGLRFNF